MSKKIYFVQGGGSSRPMRTMYPDQAYAPDLILDEIEQKLNNASFRTERVTLPKPQQQTNQTTVNTPGFKSAANEQWWLKQANDATGGKFKNIQDVIAWQKANGLVADGKFGKNSKAKWEQLNSKPATSQGNRVTTEGLYPQMLAHQRSQGITTEGLYPQMLQYQRNKGITTESFYPQMLQKQNEVNEQRLKEDWNNYEKNYINDALKNPNNYFGVSLGEYENTPLDQYYNYVSNYVPDNYYRVQNGEINPAYILKRNALDLSVPSRKQGGLLKFQIGGQISDPINQVIAGLIQNPQQTIQALSQSKDANAIIQEIVKRAKGGDQQAMQAVQVLQQVMQNQQQPQQQQPQMAEKGAKLQFIKSLRGICPEGEELTYMKKGGVMCPVCQKKKETAAKSEKKEFFGKDKKVKKDAPGDKIEAKPDSMKVYKQRSSNGDVFKTQETSTRKITTNENTGATRDSSAAGIMYYNDNRAGGGLLDSIKYDNYFKSNLKTLGKPFDVETILLPFNKKGAKICADGKKVEFFKKEPKAPLAKCGKKLACGSKAPKMDKCGGKAKMKKK